MTRCRDKSTVYMREYRHRKRHGSNTPCELNVQLNNRLHVHVYVELDHKPRVFLVAEDLACTAFGTDFPLQEKGRRTRYKVLTSLIAYTILVGEVSDLAYFFDKVLSVLLAKLPKVFKSRTSLLESAGSKRESDYLL